MKRPFCFIKFGEKEHLLQLLNFGELYFSPLSKFKGLSHEQRGDRYEGSSLILNDQFVKIECDHKALGHFEFLPSNEKSKMILYNEKLRLNFSIYALAVDIFDNQNPFSIDLRMKEFGDYALMIKDPENFLERLIKYFKDSDIQYGLDWINYLDYDSVGELKTDFFCKTQILAHQNEFRIIIGSNIEKPIKITIGNINDIAVLLPSQEMIDCKFIAKKVNQ